MSKLLILGILFSTEVNAVFVAKPLIPGISPSISVILVLESVFLIKSLVSEFFVYKSVLSLSYLVFKANALVSILITLATNWSYRVFSQYHLVYLNQKEQAATFQYLICLLQFLTS